MLALKTKYTFLTFPSKASRFLTTSDLLKLRKKNSKKKCDQLKEELRITDEYATAIRGQSEIILSMVELVPH